MSFPQESLFYSGFTPETHFLLDLLIPVTRLTSLCFFFLTYLPLSLQLSWFLTFLLTAITPATCQGYTYYLPVNMGKFLSLSKFEVFHHMSVKEFVFAGKCQWKEC